MSATIPSPAPPVSWTAAARYTLTELRRSAGRVYRAMRPSPEEVDWRHACRRAALLPRFAAGEIRLRPFVIAYTDLLSTCPQWHDLFVRRTLHFTAGSDAPRVLDCGANIGLASLYFKQLYPQARITAYEADPAIAEVCARNLQRNGWPEVDVVHAAVWTGDGTVTFRSEGADSGAVVPGGDGGPSSITVPAFRLRDVLTREPIDLLKLDIEGAEGAVLADCAEALTNVRAILLDLHEFDPSRRQTPAVLETLRDAGFTYTLSEVTPLPWLGTADRETPFGGTADVWACLVRAWRDGGSR